MAFLQLLQTTPWLLITAAVLFGLVVGSFLNVVIHRLPRMLEQGWRAECAELNGNPVPAAETYNLVLPRSRCPHCGHAIRAVENVPVLSYVALRGRCSACKAAISLRYPAVEALAGALAGYVAWRFGVSAAALGAMLFAWAMIALAFIDLDTFYLPDNLTLPLLWTGLIFNIGATFTDLTSAVIGAAGGYLVLWAVFWAYKLTTGKEGMGYGDFKLLAAIGAWLGWKMLPLVILLSSFVGAVIGIGLIVLARRGRNVPIPFGPYLALAGLIALFYGEQLNRHYLALF
ncbi:MAG: prepilin peptidase [Betaproteobacteria bacterium]|jgi:leader peptidase (prepilin peptidase)/N-methyltransferase|nr:MAG: prepilin peptidase [Betaproteobacteria bacterium]